MLLIFRFFEERYLRLAAAIPPLLRKNRNNQRWGLGDSPKFHACRVLAVLSLTILYSLDFRGVATK
jgi:hypothetical protein